MIGARSRVAVIFGASLIALAFFGATAQADDKPKLSLSAAVSAEHQQDQIQLVFTAQAESADASGANAQLIQSLNDAQKRLGKPAGVNISSGVIQIYPIYSQKNEPTIWRGRADLVLESQDILAASQAADQLTGQLALSRVTFSLSDRARRQAHLFLTERAAQAFREKADMTAKAFGYEKYEIISLEMTDSGEMVGSRPMLMGRMASADTMATPALNLQPGQESVSVTVSGWVLLR
jgi:predicted secreted protein